MKSLNPTVLLAGLAGALLPPGMARPRDHGPRERAPGLRRWKPIESITRTKQHDQQAKLERRKRMHENDDQLWQRQRAKWG